jgi:hypothetical protein
MMEAAVEHRLVETKFGLLLVPRHQFVERQTVVTFPGKCLP